MSSETSETETPRTETPGTTVPIESVPEDKPESKEERTWTEEIEVAGNQLVEKVKELINEGNVRRLIIRTPDNRVVLELPLTAGVVVGSVVTLFAPLLAALGAFAALLASVKIEIVRSEDQPPKE
jgi:hypothetical protein